MKSTNSTGDPSRVLRILQDVGLLLGLVVGLTVVYAFDMRSLADVAQNKATEVAPAEPEPEIPPLPTLEDIPLPEPESALPVPPPMTPPRRRVDPVPRIAISFSSDARFGVRTTSGNPDDWSDDNKLLTYADDGGTNNTRIWADGETPMFGSNSGSWIQYNKQDNEGVYKAVWAFRQIHVEQSVELSSGELSARTDTAKVTYTLRNTATISREVGLRVMLDTLIGKNDGVPYVVVGQRGLVTSPQYYQGENIPDAIRALEQPNLTNPGVIVNIGLRTGIGELPSEVILTHWPGSAANWDYDRISEFGSDTAVGLYYRPRPLAAGETRVVQFTYGLGTISSTASRNASLSLAATAPFRAGGKFWLTALVQQPRNGQHVRLLLPDGLSLAKSEEVARPVPAAGDFTQISWLVQIAPDKIGAVEIQARLEPENVNEKQSINILPREAKLTLTAREPLQSGTPFWITALVQNPTAGQSVELLLPAGITLAAGHTSKQGVTVNDEFTQVSWLVTANVARTGAVEVKAHLEPDGVLEKRMLQIELRKPRIQLAAKGPYQAGKPFWLPIVVYGAQPGQTLEVELPMGITFAEGHSAQKELSAADGIRAQFNWLLQTDARTSGEFEIEATLQPDGISGNQTVDIQPSTLVR